MDWLVPNIGNRENRHNYNTNQCGDIDISLYLGSNVISVGLLRQLNVSYIELSRGSSYTFN